MKRIWHLSQTLLSKVRLVETILCFNGTNILKVQCSSISNHLRYESGMEWPCNVESPIKLFTLSAYMLLYMLHNSIVWIEQAKSRWNKLLNARNNQHQSMKRTEMLNKASSSIHWIKFYRIKCLFNIDSFWRDFLGSECLEFWTFHLLIRIDIFERFNWIKLECSRAWSNIDFSRLKWIL